ncbi:MAG: CHAT domain-containing protein [Leptolyngbya sp. SIO1D8]|nr:CHAT domain-containing protein [Leptolyngbya sp. SIO1D8]
MRQLEQRLGWAVGLAILVIPHIAGATQAPPKLIRVSPELLLLAQTVSRQAEADRLLEQGRQEYVEGRLQAALTSIEAALEIYRDLSDSIGIASTLLGAGIVSQSQGEYTAALEYYQESLQITRTLGNPGIEAALLNNISTIYQAQGKYDTALDFLHEALQVARDLNDGEMEAVVLNNIGETYRLQDEYSQALTFLEESLQIARTIDNSFRVAEALNNIGGVYTSLGQNSLALNFLEESLQLKRRLGNDWGTASTLTNIGNVQATQQNYGEALNAYQQALQIAQNVGDREVEAATLNNVGEIYAERGQYDEALAVWQRSLQISEDIGSPHRAAPLSNMGLVLRRLGKYDQALEAYQQALQLTRDVQDLGGEGIILNNMAAVYVFAEQFSLAEATLTTAVKVMDVLRTRASSDVSKVALLETQQNTFQLFQKVLIAQDNYGLALEVAEQGRARAFATLLEQQLAADDTVENGPPDLEAIRAFALQQQINLVEYSIVDFIDDESDPVLYIWFVSPDGTITFQQESLANIDLPRLVTATREAMGLGGDRTAPIPTYTEEYLAQLQAETDQKLTQFHNLLIEPISDLLPTDPNQPIVFIPQGELFLVPFPALKDASGDYLIEKHTILTAPSIQVLQLTYDLVETRHGTSLQGHNAVIVGNPTMPTVTFLSEDGNFQDVRLNPLFGAQQEAEAISDFLKMPALIGNDATEATVKQRLANADLIHLATHGLLEYGDPRETGSRDTPGAIALAPGNGEDGLLTSAEILQMDLQADLVVLSACDTGRGRITGDGVIGLSRSFIAAGVPSVIVSLWAVPDAPTAELMTEFYAQLDQGQNKAQALRQAMLIMMQDHPDPKDWAAFTLIGESE